MVSGLQVDNKRGSDCTGSNGATSRTLTLDEVGASNAIITLSRNGGVLHSPDFSHNATTNVITFNIKIYNTDYVRVVYTISGSIATSTDYCDVEDVERILQTEEDFAVSTSPTESEVILFINEAEQMVDDLTQQAWRSTSIEDEYYSIPKYNVFRSANRRWVRIKLRKRKVKTFDTGSGDKLEIWNGQEWEDWITAKTEGRNDDFWINYTEGVMNLRLYYPYELDDSVRVTYRYGSTTVPVTIRQATALYAASLIISSDDRSAMLSETGDPTRMTHDDRASKWQARANRMLNHYKVIGVH